MRDTERRFFWEFNEEEEEAVLERASRQAASHRITISHGPSSVLRRAVRERSAGLAKSNLETGSESRYFTGRVEAVENEATLVVGLLGISDPRRIFAR